MKNIFAIARRILVITGRSKSFRGGTEMFGVVAGFVGAGSMLSNIVYVPIGRAVKDQRGQC